MVKNLKNYFPIIREREEVLADINSNHFLKKEYDRWKKEQQEEFINFCTGVKGVKILNDSVRLASEGTLLVTDLVVELEDGSIVNVEVQRIGYKFPGERAACYSADLLLRQYKRVRENMGKKFTYKNIKPVYTIVLFEKSPKEFKNLPETYLHYVEAKSDTGLEMNLLQKYVFIPLDIYKETRHNKDIRNKVDAWLTLFSTEEPEEIIKLITAYPEFKPMYDNIYELCRNVERMMNMFSKELQILDENTVQYMMDEMQDEINELQGKLDKRDETIEEHEKSLAEKDQLIKQLQEQLAKRK